MHELLLFQFFLSSIVAVEVKLSSELIQQHDSSFGKTITNVSFIRQCSCPEEKVCLNSIKIQVHDCFDFCWIEDEQIKKISTNPDQLKKCFASNEVLIDKFIKCVKKTRQTCVNTKSGPQVFRIDLEKLLGAGEKRFKSQAQAFMRKMGLENQNLIQSAVNVGICVKSCLIQRNHNDSCFDHSGCHPKLEEKLIGPIIKRCARKIGWQKDLAAICDCVTKAGFDSVKPYCMVLHGHSDIQSESSN